MCFHVTMLMSPCLRPWRSACLFMNAWCLQVDYSLELGPPIVTLQDARKQNSFHKLPALPGPNTNLPSGEKSALPHVQKCPMQIRGAKWHIPTQASACHHVPPWQRKDPTAITINKRASASSENPPVT